MKSNLFKKIGPKWIFLGFVLLIYLFLSFINIGLIKESLICFINLLKQIIPALLIVFIFMFLSNLFFKPKLIIRFFGEKADIRAWLIVIIGGILSAGPIYAWYPLLSDFKEKGMQNRFIATFLYNRAVKIPLLPMMVYYFSLPFAIILSFYMVIFSIINGVLVDKIIKLKKYENCDCKN